MTASHHVVATPVFDVLGELLFQMHGSLLVNGRREINPRTAHKLAAWLSLLNRDESLPVEFRELCECLRDDWQHVPAPEASSYRASMTLCAA